MEKNTYLLLFFCIKIFIPHIVCGMRKKTFMPHPPSHHKKKSRLIFFGVFFCLKNVFSSKPSQTKSVFYVYSRCHEINLLPQMNIIIDIVFIQVQNLRKSLPKIQTKYVGILHSLLLYYSVLYSVGADRSGPIMIRLLEKFFWPPSRKIV